MKNKGFTLVELLAVIVILSIIALIAVPAITGLIRESREDLLQRQLESIELSTKNWATDAENMDKLPPAGGGCTMVTLTALKNGGYANLEIINPKDRDPINQAWIKISYRPKTGNATEYSKNLQYEVSLDGPFDCVNKVES